MTGRACASIVSVLMSITLSNVEMVGLMIRCVSSLTVSLRCDDFESR